MISKSSFIRGLQCLKSLYLHKKRPFLRDPLNAETKAKYKRGHYVGKYAWEIFPNGLDCSPASPRSYKKAAIKTQESIENGIDVLYEAVFSNQNTMSIIDILKKNGDYYDAYEVKSSLAISDTYLWDISFQESVINSEKIVCKNFYIIYLNSEYKRNGEINPHQLFKIENVNQEIEKRKGLIEPLLNKMLETENLNSSPDIAIGNQCFNPYNCDFIGHCWKHIPKPSVIDIKEIDDSVKWQLLRDGKSYINSILSITTEEKIIKKINSIVSQNSFFNIDSIKTHLFAEDKHFILFSFICAKPSIPLFNSSSPFEVTPLGIQISFIDNKDLKITKTISKIFNVESDYWKEVSDFFKTLSDYISTHKILYFDDSNYLTSILQKLKTDFNINNQELNNSFFNLKILIENLDYFSHEFGLKDSFITIANHFSQNFKEFNVNNYYESTFYELAGNFINSNNSEELRRNHEEQSIKLLNSQNEVNYEILKKMQTIIKT